MNYKYYIVDALGFTYHVPAYDGMDKVKPEDVEEVAETMAENLKVEEVLKRMYINNIMICEEVYMKGEDY